MLFLAETIFVWTNVLRVVSHEHRNVFMWNKLQVQPQEGLDEPEQAALSGCEHEPRHSWGLKEPLGTGEHVVLDVHSSHLQLRQWRTITRSRVDWLQSTHKHSCICEDFHWHKITYTPHLHPLVLTYSLTSTLNSNFKPLKLRRPKPQCVQQWIVGKGRRVWCQQHN